MAGPLMPRCVNRIASEKEVLPQLTRASSTAMPVSGFSRSSVFGSKVSGTSAGRVSTMRRPNCPAIS